MANVKEVYLLVVFGLFVGATDAFFGRNRWRLPCAFKRCHHYAECQVREWHRAVCVCPKKCSRAVSPVCGTDYKTYANLCELKKKSCTENSHLRLRYYGSCKSGSCRLTFWKNLYCPYYSKCMLYYGLPRCVCPQQRCPFGYKPVCGSDYRTYRNSCELRKSACKRRKRLYILHPGHCRPDPCARIDCCCRAQCRVNETNHARCTCNFACPLHVDPVCGSDGRTYGNACTLSSAACVQQSPKLRVVSRGPCPTTAPTTPTAPMTSNPCSVINCGFYAKCEVINGSAGCSCPSLCPAVHAPVCGSNGVTYGNLCELKRDSCKNEQSIEVVNKGPCPTTAPEFNTTAPEMTTAPEINTTAPEMTTAPEINTTAPVMTTAPEINTTAPVMTTAPEINTTAPEMTTAPEVNTTAQVMTTTPEMTTAPENTTVPEMTTTSAPTLSCPIPKICLIFCDKNECAKKGQICCCQGCGNVCTTPVNESGRYVCPPVQNSCFQDSDCSNGKKCCRDGCSLKCVTPVPSVDIQMDGLL